MLQLGVHQQAGVPGDVGDDQTAAFRTLQHCEALWDRVFGVARTIIQSPRANRSRR
jgi:hypothetical protein